MKTYSPHRHHTKLSSPTHSRCTAHANKRTNARSSCTEAYPQRHIVAMSTPKYTSDDDEQFSLECGLRPSMALLPLPPPPPPPTYGWQTLHTAHVFNLQSFHCYVCHHKNVYYFYFSLYIKRGYAVFVR